MLTMIPRLNEATRHQHQSESQQLANQQLQAALAPLKAAHEQQKVQHKNNAEPAHIQRDGGRRGGGSDQGEKKAPERSRRQSKDQPDDPNAGHRLDVKV
jgi:hypothetical protein